MRVSPGITCTIQARNGSQRLPQKTTRLLGGKTLLNIVIEQIRASKRISQIIVATSLEQKDNAIEEIARESGVDCFRGSEHDLVSRIHEATTALSKTQKIIHCFGDNPFLDAATIDYALHEWIPTETDYGLLRNFPIGLGFDLYSRDLISKINSNASTPQDREHINAYVLENIESIDHTIIESPFGNQYTNTRLTIDTEKDWTLANAILDKHGTHKAFPTADEALRILTENKELQSINRSINQRYTSAKVAHARGHTYTKE